MINPGRIFARLMGGSDNTIIGNASDRLKTDASFTGTNLLNAMAFTSKTRVVTLTSPVVLTTGSYTTCFTYSGSGLLYGFNAEFNNQAIIVKLAVDGETIFDSTSMTTYNDLIVTESDKIRRQAGHGIVTSGSTIDWSLKHPIKYSTIVTISADANGGAVGSRSFTKGIIYLSKET